MRKKLEVTKRQAIRACKRQQRFILTGKAKGKWEAWKLSGNPHPCMLCHYDDQFEGGHSDCDHCPLLTQLHTNCYSPGTDYKKNPIEFARLVMSLKD